MNKTKIAIIAVILLIGSVFFLNWNKNRNQPQIKILESNLQTKKVRFEMSYKGMKFGASIKHGGIRKQVIKGHTFEAITQGDSIVFSIKGENGDILATKTIRFNG